MADLSKVSSDLFQVFIDGNAAPHHLRVDLAGFYDLIYVTSGRSGTDRLGAKVQGRVPDVTFVFQEWNEAEVKRWLGSLSEAGDASLLGVGANLPTHDVRLHDPSAADTQGDIVFPAMVFGELSRSHDGSGVAEHSVVGRAMVDGSGDVAFVGYTAP